MMTRMSPLIDRLRAVETVNDELDVLSSLIDSIDGQHQLKSGDRCEKLNICNSFALEEELFAVIPDYELSFDSPEVSKLDYLIRYVFERRYGWSEADPSSVTDFVHRRRLSVMRRTATVDTANLAAYMEEDLRFKSRINKNLDLFISWLVKHPVSTELLTSYRNAIGCFHGKAVVRNQCLKHVMEWLSNSISYVSSNQLENVYFVHIKALIVLGLTDIWSAIRNATVARLSRVLQHFSMNNMDLLFRELFSICENASSTWQAVEGSLMGISVGICQFQRVSMGISPGTYRTKTSVVDVAYILRFGNEEVTCFPEFVSKHIKEMVYSLLAHPQLSIRENAVKAYSLYISRCDLQESLVSLNTVISYLAGVNVSMSDSQTSTIVFDDTFEAKLRPELVFLDAYKAEGLLSLCVHLVKHIPPGYLLSDVHWPVYFSIFSLYLMHSASTVRQTASNIFKFLVARDSSNPALLKLIIHGLISHWNPDVTLLTTDYSELMSESLTNGKKRLSVEDCIDSGCCARRCFDASVVQSTWQWREGRMLAYELILQFLIKNHLLYTFGPLQPVTLTSSQTESSQPEQTDQTDAAKPCRSLHQSFKATSGTMRKGASKETHEVTARRHRVRSYSFTCTNHHHYYHAEHPRKKHIHHDQCSYDRHIGAIAKGTAAAQASANELVQKEQNNKNKASTDKQTASGTGRHSIATLGLSKQQITKLQKFGQMASTLDEVEEQADVPGDEIGHRNRIDSVCTVVPYNKFACRQSHNGLVPTQAMSLLAASVHLDSLYTKLRKDPLGNESGSTGTPSHCSESTLSDLLSTILYQCIESLADSNWELRRMSSQLLPCIVEVMRWYDIGFITSFLTENFTGSKTSVLEYGAAMAVKYSLHHAATLQHFLRSPTPAVELSAANQKVIELIVTVIRSNVSSWFAAAVRSLTYRPVIDKISLIALEIIMLAEAYFSLDETQTLESLTAVFNVFANFYCKTNSSQPLAISLAKLPSYSDKCIVPATGFLSCSTKSDVAKHSWLHQVEKVMLNDLRHVLSSYICSCHASAPRAVIQYMPILAAFVYKYIDSDVSLAKLLMESTTFLCKSLVKLTDNKACTGYQDDHDAILKSAVLGWQQLCSIMSHKSTDTATLKQVAELCRQMLFVVTPLSAQLQLLLQALCKKINAASDDSKLNSSGSAYTNLTLLSNCIPSVTTTDASDELGISDEEDTLGHSLHDMQLLSSSTGSGGNFSPRPSGHLSSSKSNVTAADAKRYAFQNTSTTSWDSDSDENWSDAESEKPSEVRNQIGQFLCSLKQELIQKGFQTDFENGLQLLADKDKRLIASLIT